MRFARLLLAFTLTFGTPVFGQTIGPPIGGGVSPIIFNTLPNGNASSTIVGSGTYASATLGTPSSASWGGTCTGASTVSGLSASTGAWSATFTTPSSACSGSISVIWPNALAVSSPSVTISPAVGCTNSLIFSTACNSQYIPVVM